MTTRTSHASSFVAPIGTGVDTEKVVVTATTDQRSKAVMTYDLATVPAVFRAIVTMADDLAGKLPRGEPEWTEGWNLRSLSSTPG